MVGDDGRWRRLSSALWALVRAVDFILGAVGSHRKVMSRGVTRTD